MTAEAPAPENPTLHAIGMEAMAEHVPNKVEQLMAEQFSAPELWGNDRDGPQPYGLQTPYELGYPVETAETKVIDNPDEVWLLNIYGLRVVPDTEATTTGAVKIDATDLETITKIGEAIAGGILQGEHGRIAKIVAPSNPEAVTRDPEANNNWLQLIEGKEGAEGVWPVVPNFDHDYQAVHLGNMLMFPKEVQDMITETAQHSRSRREQFLSGEVTDKVLRLPVDDAEGTNPWGKKRQFHNDGIMEIDDLTDADNYLPLIAYLSGGPSETVEARLEKLLQYANNDVIEHDAHDPMFRAMNGLQEMHGLLADVANFNMRFREGRNITPEEVEDVYRAFINGTVRVAKKIRGEWQEPAEQESQPLAVAA